MAGISTSPSGVGLPIGLAGATAATRYVGGTASGAPVSGTFAVGDFVVDQLGNEFVCVTAGSPGTWTRASASRERLYAAAAGILTENVNPTAYYATAAPGTQTVYAFLMGLHAGDVVTGIVLRNITAAAGTLPTTARFGIADSTGKMLALSGNLNSLAQWAVAANQYALTAPYTVLADGGYYGCFVVNGTWGATQPAVLRGQAVATQAFPGVGSAPPPAFSWAGQTDLPAVNSSLTVVGTTVAIGFYMGFY